MITFTDAWRRAAIHPDGTMTIRAHKTSSIGWTVALPAATRILHVDAGTLEFQPAGAHQVAALANLGHQLLQEIDAYRPGFLWTASPAEIVGALIEEISAAACDAAAQAVEMQHQQPGVEIGIHYPAKATPALFDVLGLPNFRTGPIAHVFRAAGAEIRTKCEDEQAFVLDRFLRLAIKHGDSWREAAETDIKAAYERINTGKAGAS
ncbi:hypothetical protein [Janthinobacterium sp.]|uniref:hypothetical protein n=1 Tax=Janthinobacterium sp. TaxID=1871054 RepID=UPI0026045F07|nr:hypothetical protein [Janthinobacterium sp.]